MAESRFDPTHALRFDLAAGRVELTGGSPRALVPAEALGELLSSVDVEAARDFGHRIGTEIGRRIAGRIEAATASLEGVTDQLGGELAIAGLGSLVIERWGQALVARIDGSPLAGQAAELLGPVVETALQRALARDVHAVVLDRREGVRLLLVAQGAADKVTAWLAEGVAWGDALARLHGGAS